MKKLKLNRMDCFEEKRNVCKKNYERQKVK